MDQGDNSIDWRSVRTYFTGKVSMLVTYPIIGFAAGILIGYLAG
ncbi:hypothetical protein QSJ19_13705 [Gordonia sp. ABSL11-1]|nr:hypothetical protein [Gordonia sp. ABSL11-1]MDL9946625.1 hypothetical protein [Gordonia sp. ABSL11-1]